MEKERLILEEKTIYLLDISKKMQAKYSKERQILFSFFNNPDADLESWKNYIDYFNNLLIKDKIISA